MQQFWDGFTKEAEASAQEKRAFVRRLGRLVGTAGSAPKSIGKAVETVKNAPKRMWDSAAGKYHLGRAEAQGVPLSKYHHQRAKSMGMKPAEYGQKYRGQIAAGSQVVKKERDAARAVQAQRAAEEKARKAAFKAQQQEAAAAKTKEKRDFRTKALLGGAGALALGGAAGAHLAGNSNDGY